MVTKGKNYNGEDDPRRDKGFIGDGENRTIEAYRKQLNEVDIDLGQGWTTVTNQKNKFCQLGNADTHRK